MEIVDREVIHDGFMVLSLCTLRLADGMLVTREVLERGDATGVLPYDAERRTALLVRQPRVPIMLNSGRTDVFEAIAGMIDDEEAGDAARREAMEEAGVVLRELEFVTHAWTSPGALTERIALFLAPYTASDVTGPGGGVAEENESIEVLEMPLHTLATMADRGDIVDMKTLVLILTLRLRRPELFGKAA
jgi:nudix-type nucleoside diphosphatase (YffH/AdpP family)